MDHVAAQQDKFTSAANTKRYFEVALTFLETHQWIYNIQLTHYWLEQPWNHVPKEWREVLCNLTLEEMHSIPDGFLKDIWPQSLRSFILQAQELSLLQQQPSADVVPVNISNDLKRGMRPKKLHEVCNAAAVISEIHNKQQSSLVVDVGSGLGYLGQVLSSRCGLKALGLERKEAYSCQAGVRTKHQEFSGPGFESVTFELHDNEECFKQFEDLLKSRLEVQETTETQRFPSGCESKCSLQKHAHTTSGNSHPEISAIGDVPNGDDHQAVNTLFPSAFTTLPCTLHAPYPKTASLVGLHCCGDLTPTMLHLFLSTHQLRSLVCVSCCYHKMSQSGGKFTNFPLSDTLNELHKTYSANHPDWVLNTFALRLASQETRARWKAQSGQDHDFHMKNVAYRGIMEVFFAENGKTVQKRKRRIANHGAYNDFDSYIDAVLERNAVEGVQVDIAFRQRLKQLYEDYEPYFCYIEPFTCLQVVLQPVLESLLLLDRMIYLREKGIHATLKAVMHDHISPRNMALVASK